MSENAISISNLTFSYAKSKPIIDIESFHIAKGERVFLYGPSGTGKTTLLGLLAGIIQAKSGSLNVLGQEFVNLSGFKRDQFRSQHIGYIFQMFNLIPYLNGIDNIVIPCQVNRKRRHGKSNRELYAEGRELAATLGIDRYLNKNVLDLSVGQQQRIAVARSLLGDPEIILADEPTSALDFEIRLKFLDLLFEQCEKKKITLLFVSHDKTLSPRFERVISLAEINKTVRRV